ncbi:MAG: hypothetical protein JNM53_02915 [Gemmatimonadetes bacterium]|nr:hypothetical protein [Gemmatimonadota bacterium]
MIRLTRHSFPGPLAVLALSSGLGAQVPRPCLEPQLYALNNAPAALAARDEEGRVAASLLLQGLRTLHERAVAQRLSPDTVRAGLLDLYRDAAQRRPELAPLGLAYLVVNGDVLLHPFFVMEDLAWLYHKVSGAAGPVLAFTEARARPENRLTALRAIRVVEDSVERRVVLRYACEAARTLLAFNRDSEWRYADLTYGPARDAGFLLPHAMRLLGAEERAAFEAIADQLYLPPQNGKTVLSAYTRAGWEWEP